MRMRFKKILPFCLPFLLTFSLEVAAQNNPNYDTSPSDTLETGSIAFTPEEASAFIVKLTQNRYLWSEQGSLLRFSLQRLLEHYEEPFDSVRSRLSALELSSEAFEQTSIQRYDTLSLRWLNDSTFIFLDQPLSKEPFLYRQQLIPVEPDTRNREEDELSLPGTLPLQYDTLRYAVIDTMYLDQLNLKLHRWTDNTIFPPLAEEMNGRTIHMLPDSSAIIISTSMQAIMGLEDSPFRRIPSKQMPDSLQAALQTLLHYTLERDSVLIHLSSLNGRQIPLWLTTRQEEMQRFWVKNHANDSITIWVANPERNAIRLVLEENVNVERREKRPADHIPISTLRPSTTLASFRSLEEIPVFWSYNLASSLTLNQTFFSNWARGGESSLATTFDIRSSANYTNKVKKSKWNTEARLRYGSISSDGYKSFRTNTDILEFNSQYNSELREKLDFSSTAYFKTQVAKGYKSATDDQVISRFMNPGSFTIGVGIEYEPVKDTRLNFSPLSYRNTFVLDTAGIDQTLHGIEAGRRARQEMGGQLVVRNRFKVMEGLNVANNIRLFSGYLDKPQNVDVDWEINIEKQFNWYFMVRLNLHMIYDDDIRFPVLDDGGNPVLLPDGTPKRAPRTQLKQLLGLTMAFRI